MNLDIPTEVREAAALVERFAAQSGWDDWELMGIASRKYLNRLQEELREERQHNRERCDNEKICGAYSEYGYNGGQGCGRVPGHTGFHMDKEPI